MKEKKIEKLSKTLKQEDSTKLNKMTVEEAKLHIIECYSQIYKHEESIKGKWWAIHNEQNWQLRQTNMMLSIKDLSKDVSLWKRNAMLTRLLWKIYRLNSLISVMKRKVSQASFISSEKLNLLNKQNEELQ